ncbi:pyridoxamine 5'-phosphate oxidase family protein [Planococcus shenhongbingii]|uniref:Pyridoxamine 5'-phosphate oxidase family protein n=1 Tax=Planococcus shenhongbingii TaxID=3058398 RepID=A0ABT8NFB1_9BACL|nr:pyridoxamine 5'-phosphate oxidase family protein [Planococcus sp. N017]MDN7246394.1 pyridoxamine 5'-phosphate oxidase family protein [Planococcus sp. N017]
MADKSTQEAIEKVKELIKDIEVAMFTTISNGKAVSRPMQTQETEFDGDLWFMTMKDTAKYQEILQNPTVNLAYSGKSYVSISGTAEISEDLEKKKEFWNPILGKLLETTYDDPNVVLIKVSAETAEYWETGNKLKSAAKFVKKLTTKETMDEDSDLNETVEFDRLYGSDN